MSTDAAQLAGEPVSPVRHAWKTWLVRHKILTVAAALVVVAATATSAAVLLSGPSYPHAWCGPVLAHPVSLARHEMVTHWFRDRAVTPCWNAAGTVRKREAALGAGTAGQPMQGEKR
jgi:hypothetical protein